MTLNLRETAAILGFRPRKSFYDSYNEEYINERRRRESIEMEEKVDIRPKVNIFDISNFIQCDKPNSLDYEVEESWWRRNCRRDADRHQAENVMFHTSVTMASLVLEKKYETRIKSVGAYVLLPEFIQSRVPNPYWQVRGGCWRYEGLPGGIVKDKRWDRRDKKTKKIWKIVKDEEKKQEEEEAGIEDSKIEIEYEEKAVYALEPQPVVQHINTNANIGNIAAEFKESGMLTNEAEGRLKQYYRAHFMIHGEDEKSIRSAYNKMTLLSARLSLDGTDWCDLNVKIIHLVALEGNSESTVDVIDELEYWKYWWAFKRIGIKVFKVGVVMFGALFTIWLFRKKKRMAAGLAIVGAGVFAHRHFNGTERYQEFLEDFCCGEQKMPEISEYCKFKRDSVNPKCVARSTKIGFTVALNHIYRPRSCTHNLKRAILYRQLLPSLGTVDSRVLNWKIGIYQLQQALKLVIYEDPGFEIAFEMWLADSQYNEARKKMLRRALQNIKDGRPFEHTIMAHVKTDEILVGKEYGKRDPRCISSPGDEALVLAAPGYHGWQKQCCKIWSTFEKAMEQRYIYAGGLDAVQLSAIVTWLEHNGYRAYEGDYSRYDGHTEEEAMIAEFEFYEGYIDNDIIEVLKHQTSYKGRTRCGMKYKCKGKMNSGVINTSFGNTIRNFMMFAAYVGKYAPDLDFYMIALGDDNMIFVKGELDIPLFVQLTESMGHKLEIVDRAFDYNRLEFCSSRFCDIGVERLMIPKLGRFFAKNFVCNKHVEDIDVHMQRVAVGFKNYSFLPGIRSVLASIGDVGEIKEYIDRNPYKIKLPNAVEVDPLSVKAYFEDVYGMDCDEFESVCDNIDWSRSGMVYSHWMFDQLCRVDGIITDTSFEFSDYVSWN